MFKPKTNLLIVCLAGFLFWIIYLSSSPLVLVHPDSAKYANIASNFYQYKKLCIDTWYPAWFNYASIEKSGPWMSFYPALYPIWMSLFFIAFGIKDFSVVISSGVFFLLSIPLFYLLARKIFGEKIAFLSSLIFITQPQLLFYSRSGLTESMFIFFILAGFLVLYDAQKIMQFVFAGLIFGLALKTRTSGFIYLCAGAFFVYLIHRHNSLLKKIVSFFSGVLCGNIILQILCAPFSVGQAPFSMVYTPLFHSSNIFPYDSLMRSFDKIDPGFILSHLGTLLLKAWGSLRYIYQSCLVFLPESGFPFYHEYYAFLPILLFLYLLSIFRRFEEGQPAAFKITVALLAVFNLIFHLFTIPELRYLHPVLPFMIILGIEFFYFLATRLFLQLQVYVLWSCLIFFILLPQVLTALQGKAYYQELNFPTQYKILTRTLAKNTSSRDIIMTNIDSWAGWYARRRTVYLPLRKDFDKLRQKINIDAIFLVEYPDWKVCNIGKLPEDWHDLVIKPGDFDDFSCVDSAEISLVEVETLRPVNVKAVLYKKKP